MFQTLGLTAVLVTDYILNKARRSKYQPLFAFELELLVARKTLRPCFAKQISRFMPKSLKHKRAAVKPFYQFHSKIPGNVLLTTLTVP